MIKKSWALCLSAMMGVVLVSCCGVMADGVSYNDLSWATGQLNTAITKYAPSGVTNGFLVTYPSNVVTTVRVGITGAASVGGYPDNIPAGSDAYVHFNGKISCSNGVYWSSGDIVLTFTGLNTAKVYEVAAFSSRGYASASYSNRFTISTLSDVTSFTNSSSVGIVKSTTAMANDTASCVAGNLTGMIYKYTAINPGADGDMQLKFSTFANPGYGTNGYLNAFMLTESTPAPAPAPASGPVIFLK